MKPGDLVRPRYDVYRPDYNYGVGLVVYRLHKSPFLRHNEPETSRWAVLWTNPLYTMKDGTSVQYEGELEVIGEAG